ncbi:MAG: hypothetical protein J6Y77_00430 [Paludibacteraceae bacterium]|nr:hypothetical protein [Paludibacteraceae bacterium]
MKINPHFLKNVLKCLPLLVLTACIDHDWTMSDIDTRMGVNTKLVAPLAHSHIKLVEALPAEWGTYRFIFDEDDYVYIVRYDTTHIGRSLVEDLRIYPSGLFSREVPVGTPGGGMVTSAPVNSTFDFNFTNVNTDPNERLDSMEYASGTLELWYNQNLDYASGSLVYLSFPKDEFLLDPVRYPDNKVAVDFTTCPVRIDVTGARLYLNGGQTIHFHFEGTVVTNTPFEAGTTVLNEIDFDKIEGRVFYGNVGTEKTLYEGEKIFALNYVNDMDGKEYNLPFYDPEITMFFNNSIGLPVRYCLDYMVAYIEGQTDTIRASFGGVNPDTTSLVLAYPVRSDIDGLNYQQLLTFDVDQINKYSEQTYTRDFGATHLFMRLNPDRIRYKYHIESIDPNTHNVHYFFDDSDIDLVTKAKFRLWFEGEPNDPDKNFYISQRDTTEFNNEAIDLGEVTIADTTYAILKLEYTNHIPVGVKAHIRFLDENKQPILTDVERDFVIDAAPVDNNGVAMDPKNPNTKIHIRLNFEQLQTMMTDVKWLVYEYRISNENRVTVMATNNDWLEMDASIYLEGGVEYDPKE